MERIIFHIDVNSAFLSWTSVENLRTGRGPDLRLIPAIIGGDQSSRHGIVLAKSIPAKAFGIYTSQPVAQALRLCGDLTVYPPEHELYRRFSRELMAYLKSLTPDVEQLSIDECFLDFTGIAHRYPSPVRAAHSIKDTIYARFGFTVNIGISSNKLLAKMASDFEKPNRVHTLFPSEVPEKMWPLPVGELYMAGRSSVQTLRKLGIRTIGDLAKADPALLRSHLKSHGETLWRYANGLDSSPVAPNPAPAKGIGNSITLAKDAKTRQEAYPVLRRLAESVSARLRKAGQMAGSVCVEMKYADFVSVSHQTQLFTPCRSAEELYRTACGLFDKLWNGGPIRLLGIRASKLTAETEPVQLSLFDTDIKKSEKERRLDKALDAIRSRYGKDAVRRGMPPETSDS